MVKLHALAELAVDCSLAQFFRRDYPIKIDIERNHRTQRNWIMGSHRLITRSRDFERIPTGRKL
jgi:hypothetical protein